VPFPDFDPILFQIGPFAIRWYALAYVAGILLGWRYATSLVRTGKLWGGRTPPVTIPQIDDLILWVTLGVILGGRLGYVLFYSPSLIWTDPLEVLKVWHGGMSFHGGLIGVTLALVGFARVNKVELLRLSDLVAPCVPIGLFFGRIANFINGELWGRPTDAPWAVVFPAGGPQARHPSQLYEAALEGLALFIILRIATHKALWLQRRGALTGLFLLGYAVFRMSLEAVREPDAFMPDFPLGMTMGMLLSLPMALAGFYLIWRGLREDPAPVAADEPA
jgi:phosphatidylglycerol:prolipoprotein diacylglycerol transferase